jgi:hypothetical protein
VRGVVLLMYSDTHNGEVLCTCKPHVIFSVAADIGR